MPTLVIPNRFESLKEAFGNEVRPLIVPIDPDLKVFNRLRGQARVQNGGLLCFLLGATGVGKTTAVYSAVVNMRKIFAPVISVPLEIDLRDAVAWITAHAPPKQDKTTLLLLDSS